MPTPLVTVVMPVYNGMPFLVDAVASILEQSFPDWQLLCVNDGSTDRSGPVLDWFARQDSRIEVIHQSNGGIVSALNNGIFKARSQFICRMDSDDISLPERLEKQTAAMRQQSDWLVLGTGILEMDTDNAPLQTSRLPLDHPAILDNLLHRRTGHFHPTTLIRTEPLQALGGYRKRYQWVEDHDLWLRLAQHGRLANLPDILLCYRQHSSSVCWQRAASQRKLMNELLAEAHQQRGLSVPREVVVEYSQRRSAAGPGKWARAAAKGGLPTVAWKHLTALNRGSDKLGYKARMNLEVTARLLAGAVCRPGSKSAQALQPPGFPEWHARLHASGILDDPLQIAHTGRVRI